jgi:hypothetical protein
LIVGLIGVGSSDWRSDAWLVLVVGVKVTRLLIQILAALKRGANLEWRPKTTTLPHYFFALQAQELSLDCVEGQWTTARSGKSSEVPKRGPDSYSKRLDLESLVFSTSFCISDVAITNKKRDFHQVGCLFEVLVVSTPEN